MLFTVGAFLSLSSLDSAQQFEGALQRHIAP